MKALFHFSFSCVVALSMLFVGGGCTDNDTPENDPGVSFEGEPAVTANSAVFTIRVANADRAAWMILDAAESAPTVGKVLDEGQQLSGKESYAVTANNLKVNTSYKVYAAAAKGEVTSRIAELAVATSGYTQMVTLLEAGKNFLSYHVEVPEGTAYSHLGMVKRLYDNYSAMGLQQKDIVATMLGAYGMIATGSQDLILRDLQERENGGRPYDVIAGLPYVIMAGVVNEYGQLAGDFQVIELSTPAPEKLTAEIGVEIVNLQAESVDIRITPDASLKSVFEQVFPKSISDELIAKGGMDELKAELVNIGVHITDYTKLSEWISLYPKTDYIYYIMGIDANGDQTEIMAHPFSTSEAVAGTGTENLEFIQAPEAIYYGQPDPQSGYDFNLLLSTQTMSKNEHNEWAPDEVPCHAFYVDFFAGEDPGETRVLPEGIYTLSESNEGGTLGYWNTWAAYIGVVDEDYMEYEYESGTITVTHVTEGYRLDIDLVTSEGGAYTGSYTGPIEFQSDAPSPFSNSRSRKGAVMKQRSAPMPEHR